MFERTPPALYMRGRRLGLEVSKKGPTYSRGHLTGAKRRCMFGVASTPWKVWPKAMIRGYY
jgi:hypothetical protein